MVSKVDVIIPVYFIDHAFFSENIKSWVRELPIQKFYFGVGNKRYDVKSFEDGLKEFIPEEIEYEVIDQIHLKTLGACLADLMKRVQTKWFVFLHCDVFLTENCFSLMRTFMKSNYGIIESNRCYQKERDGQLTPAMCYSKDRAYSGFQVIQKQAIKEIIEKIEDDYIYRNEDFIFQNAIKNAGFEYKKTWVMHYHQNQDVWSEDRKKAMNMQWKGLVKYTTPDPICLDACLQALLVCMKDTSFNLYQTLLFIQEHNIIWKESIFLYFMCELIKNNKK